MNARQALGPDGTALGPVARGVKQASKGEDHGCLFCELQKQDDEEALILARSERSFAVLTGTRTTAAT